MRILALDTTGAQCSAALCDRANILAFKAENIGRGHAERLAPMVAELLSAAKLSATSIDKIVVCTGPGSFTGLRVALAFAKGFALPRRLPVVGLSSLAVWASQKDPESIGRIAAAADVRRGQICWAGFEKGVQTRPPVTQDEKTARAYIAAFKPDHIIEDGLVDTRILAWLGAGLSPQDYPALPLYSRPPDAKVAGGKTPK